MVRLVRWIPISTVLWALSACGGGSSSDSGGQQQADSSSTSDVSIPFEAFAAGTAINCDADLQNLGLSSVDASVRNFAFFVHDVQLLTDGGDAIAVTLDESDWQNQGVALLDFQDRNDSCNGVTKPTNTSLAGTFSDADMQGKTITGLRFTIGVPGELNHANPASAASPLNRADMFWSWQSGYKHMRLDVAPVGGVTKVSDGSTTASWNFHLGDTGCVGDAEAAEPVSCSAENRPVISLTGYTLGTSVVYVDYAQLVAMSAINEDHGGAIGCMSGPTDPECDELFDQLGLGLNGQPDPNAGQQFFTVVDPS